MMDTNQINSAVATAQDLHAQLSANWPAITAAAVIVARELRNFNVWVVGVAEFVIRHGGVVMIARKLIWNPSANSQLPTPKS